MKVTLPLQLTVNIPSNSPVQSGAGSASTPASTASSPSDATTTTAAAGMPANLAGGAASGRSGLTANQQGTYQPGWIGQISAQLQLTLGTDGAMAGSIVQSLDQLRYTQGPAPAAGASQIVLGDISSPGLLDRWSKYIGQISLTGAIDVGSLVQWVLRQSYLETTEDLRFYAHKVQWFNDMKKAIRDELQKARDVAKLNAGKKDTDALQPPYEKRDFDTNYNSAGSSGASGTTARVEEMGTSVQIVSSSDVPASIRTAAESKMGSGNIQWMKTAEDEYIATNLSAHTQADKDDIMIFVPDATVANKFHVTLIWGDPHVDEMTLNADGTLTGAGSNNYDWHFGVDSEFILPSGTRILINSEQQAGAGEWYAEGMSVIAGNSRVSVGKTNEGEVGSATPYNDGATYYARQNLQMYETNAQGQRVKTGGHFALSSNGQWAVRGDDGRFYDVSDKSWNDFTSSKSGASPGKAIDHGTNQVVAGSATQGFCYTKGQLDGYIKNLEEKLNSTGDDAQLANVDLQNVLQKQQQTLQAMSNISKVLFETAMAVIRKIGG